MIVSIIIPVFNEKNNIEKIIKDINEKINYNKQIIVVDDHSNDGKIIHFLDIVDQAVTGSHKSSTIISLI